MLLLRSPQHLVLLMLMLMLMPPQPLVLMLALQLAWLHHLPGLTPCWMHLLVLAALESLLRICCCMLLAQRCLRQHQLLLLLLLHLLLHCAQPDARRCGSAPWHQPQMLSHLLLLPAVLLLLLLPPLLPPAVLQGPEDFLKAGTQAPWPPSPPYRCLPLARG